MGLPDRISSREISAEEADRLWVAWTPGEVAARLSGVAAPWYVAAGWALDLFTGGASRPHGDIEIGVPAAGFGEIAAALPGYDWEVVGDGRAWPYPAAAEHHFQTWLREPGSGRYRLDVFREAQAGDRWVCRRDPSITVSYAELILRTDDGIPYSIPEVALLFKAKGLRAKDEVDFERVLPAMDQARRARLFEWLSRVHPGHAWLARL
ncbi:nucleotidyltransferase domain-containing protein [Nocardia brasiliensis]|uniref:nucleotidyltransferase domain-containing protein n=1 Tax=Nocardia brasiliensis TaxID=37326 RepID=UPI0018956FA4|nr:hypothetical protein [Nocardia brasiliensis]MBF6129385.1 hypothetical protein [Nocardia brasiliensis]